MIKCFVSCYFVIDGSSKLMKRDKSVRDSYWDNLKGVLIILVVCGHLCERYIDNSNLLRHLWIVIYSFHMPLFIFVNGYFARKSSKPAGQKSIKMLKYYLLMQVLFVIGDWLIREKDFEISILSDPSYCCWYLLFLVYAYLIMGFVPEDNKQVMKWFAVSIVLSLLVGFDTSVGHAYAVGRTFYFLPYFFLGIIWADIDIELKTSKYKRMICVILCGISILLLWKLGSSEWFNRSIFSGHKAYEALYPGHQLFAMLNKIGAYVIAIFIAYIVLNLIPRRKTFFCFFGKHTLLIYLVHIFVLPMEFYMIQDMVFVGREELNSIIILLILVLTSAIICLGISIVYKVLFPKMIKVILKEKVNERGGE